MISSIDKSIEKQFASIKPSTWMWVIFLVGVFIRCLLVWQPVPVLITKNLPDDTYYYFSIARNIVETGSVSIDGIHTTNGFHPLWLFLLLPIFSLPLNSIDLHVHLALTLTSVLDSLAIPVIWLIARNITRNEGASLFAALCYALNPVAILQGTNGLETGLAQCLLVCFWLLLVRWMDNPRSRNRMVFAGVVGGLMLLARNDTVFFFGAGVLAWLLLTGVRQGWKSAFTVSIIAIIINIPWYLASRWLLGSWVQDSGLAVPYAIQERWTINHGPALYPRLLEGIRQIFLPPYWLRGDPTGLPLFIGIALWIIVLSVLINYWVKSRDLPSMAAILPAIAAGVMLILFHGGLRWYPRPWYFFVLSAAWPVAAALAISLSSNPVKILRFAYPAIVAYFVLSGMIFWQNGLYPWQEDFIKASYWMKENTPSDARIGSFNAGIYSYYSDRTIVNLDGVVNHDAFIAIQGKRILPFLDKIGVDYLVDSDMAVTEEYGPFLGGELTSQFKVLTVIPSARPWAIGPVRIYRVIPDRSQ